MEWTLKSDIEILEEIGRRMQETRLERNLLQKEAAERAGVSLTTLQRMEGGKAISFIHLIKVLRAFDMLEKLEMIFPAFILSPMILRETQGKKRLRARNKERK